MPQWSSRLDLQIFCHKGALEIHSFEYREYSCNIGLPLLQNFIQLSRDGILRTIIIRLLSKHVSLTMAYWRSSWFHSHKYCGLYFKIAYKITYLIIQTCTNTYMRTYARIHTRIHTYMHTRMFCPGRKGGIFWAVSISLYVVHICSHIIATIGTMSCMLRQKISWWNKT